jgi:hypothetical protein
MPKAIFITPSNLPLVSELSGWPGDPEVIGYFYVEDVQFPHGYVDKAIITAATYHATFNRMCGDTELVPVDYL